MKCIATLVQTVFRRVRSFTSSLFKYRPSWIKALDSSASLSPKTGTRLRHQRVQHGAVTGFTTTGENDPSNNSLFDKHTGTGKSTGAHASPNCWALLFGAYR